MTESFFSRKNAGNKIFTFRSLEVYEKQINDQPLITVWHYDKQIALMKLNHVRDNIFEISNLYIKRSYRNRGIGSDLIKQYVSTGKILILKYDFELNNFLHKLYKTGNLVLSIKNLNDQYENIFYHDNEFLTWNGNDIEKGQEVFIYWTKTKINELKMNKINYQDEKDFNHSKDSTKLLPFKLSSYDITGTSVGKILHLTLWDNYKQILAMSLSMENFKGFKVFDVLSVSLRKSYAGKNIGLNFYKLLILRGMNLMSSDSQSEGAIKLWNKLAADPSISIFYIEHETIKQINNIDRSLIKSNAKIIATKINSDFYNEFID